MLLEFLASELVFPTTFSPIKPDIFPRLCQEPRWDTPSVRIQCDFSVLEWLASVLLSSLFSKWFEFCRFLNLRTSLFFCSWERRLRAHCPQSHILSATPLWGSRLKMLRNECYHEFSPFKLVFPPQWRKSGAYWTLLIERFKSRIAMGTDVNHARFWPPAAPHPSPPYDGSLRHNSSILR